jgi:hypothetical protein
MFGVCFVVIACVCGTQFAHFLICNFKGGRHFYMFFTLVS